MGASDPIVRSRLPGILIFLLLLIALDGRTCAEPAVSPSIERQIAMAVAVLVERVAPDVLVKAAQYSVDRVVGREIVEARGGRIVLAPMKGTYATSKLIEKVKSP